MLQGSGLVKMAIKSIGIVPILLRLPCLKIILMFGTIGRSFTS